jgi:hypothetical protein
LRDISTDARLHRFHQARNFYANITSALPYLVHDGDFRVRPGQATHEAETLSAQPQNETEQGNDLFLARALLPS